MTRDEIDDLIEYLEKNYYVKCKSYQAKDEFEVDEIRVLPLIPICFRGQNIRKTRILIELDKLDLIRF